jgi:magnesium and cobalt exporter, CNNM family
MPRTVRETAGMTIGLVAALAALVVLAAVLGAAEAALLRVAPVRVEVRASEGARGAKRLLPLLDDLPRVVNTILLSVLLVQIGAATLAGVLAARYFGNLGITITSIVLTIVLFVYAESIPKTYAVLHPVRVAEASAPLVRGLTIVLRPLVSVLVWLADLQSPGRGVATPTALSQQELVHLAKDAAAKGRIDDTDLDLIERAFALGDLTVDRVLVPRTEVVGIPANATVAEGLEVANRAGHRRLPLYDEDLDNVIGIVLIRDLARAAIEDPGRAARSVARPELLVPGTRRVVDLLGDMQASGTHFAVVIDEHGGTEGIVTIEDVVAQLVGDIAEPEPHAEPVIDRLGSRRWRADAAVSVSDLEAATGADLPPGDWSTVGGLVIGTAGRIPASGEIIEVGGLSIRVLEALPQRLVSVEVTAPQDGRSSPSR